MSTRGFVRALLGMMAAAFALACLNFAPNALAAEKVKIGAAVSWPAYALWAIIDAQKLAPDLELEVSILNDPLMGHSMLATGQLDVYNTTPDYGPIAAENGFPFKIVAMTSISRGVDQLAFAPGIDFGNIKGKRVAAPQAFVGQLMMGVWLAANGVAASDVEWVNLDAEAATSALLSGDLAATYTYEPWSSKLLQSLPGAKIVANSGEAFFLERAFLGDSIFMSDAFLRDRHDTAIKLLKAYWQALAWYKVHPAEGNQIFVDNLQWPLADIESVMGKDGTFLDIQALYLFDYQESSRFCGVLPGDLPHGITNGQFFDAFRVTNAGWKDLGLVKTTMEPEQIIDCSLLKELVDSDFAP